MRANEWLKIATVYAAPARTAIARIRGLEKGRGPSLNSGRGLRPLYCGTAAIARRAVRRPATSKGPSARCFGLLRVELLHTEAEQVEKQPVGVVGLRVFVFDVGRDAQSVENRQDQRRQGFGADILERVFPEGGRDAVRDRDVAFR